MSLLELEKRPTHLKALAQITYFLIIYLLAVISLPK